MPPVNQLVAKKLQERERARTDRLFLANEVLGFDFQEAVHQELFSSYPTFQDVTSVPWVNQFEKRDVLILWPRGHFKTTALVVIAIQAILNFPDIRILLMQGSVQVTKTLLRQICSHFDGTAMNSRFKELFPEFCGTKKELQLSSMSFRTPARRLKQLAQATCTVASPKSVKTGQHYDLGIFDDLVNDQNYNKPEKLAKIEEEFNMSQPLIDPGCPRFVSGTRYAFGDLYESIMRRDAGKNDWTISLKTCWKNEADPNSGVRFEQRQTHHGKIIGFTREGLLQIMRDTPAMFCSQYLNRPASEVTQSITEAELNAAVIIPPQAPPLSRAVFFVDLAAPGINPDDSVVIVGKIDGIGKQYVVEWYGAQYDPILLGNVVMQLALKYRPLKILFEGTPSAKYFVPLLQMMCRDKGMELPIDYIKVDQRDDAKNFRVRAMCANVKQKRLFFFAGLFNWQKFCDQTTQFPKGKYGHDDYPDTVGLMNQYFATSYIGIAPPTITRHPIIAMLDRDPISSVDLMNQEVISQNSTMGDEFS